MFKYLLLVQLLFAKQLYGFELFSEPFEEEFDISDNEPNNNPPPLISEQHYNFQKLNHFDSTDRRIWRQRYFVDKRYYKPGGPVFLMIARSHPQFLLTISSWTKYAEQHGAMCVVLEHRYYGLSWPTNDLSLENLIYLNSQQVLADAVNVIQHINRIYELKKDTKWIAFGGGYTGSLAAWLRLKYPHLVHGAVTSSAHFRPAVTYPDYFGITGEKLGKHAPECKSAIQDAFSDLNTLLDDPEGQQKVKEVLQIGSIPNEEPEFKPLDISYLNMQLADIIAAPINSNNNSYINLTCDFMTNEELGTPLHRLAAYLYRDYNGSYLLSNGYYNFVNFLLDTSNYRLARLGIYQQCTEFGLFETSDDPEHVFGNRFPKDYFKRLCSDAFGPGYSWDTFEALAARRQYQLYGGEHLNITNVVFVQGSNDPMHPLGILKEPNPTSPVILIEGAPRFADLYPDRLFDSPQLKEAREKISNYIGAMLE